MPPILSELGSFINRMPPRDTWKRLRIAVSLDEWLAIREYYFADAGRFVDAVRGVPLQLEEHPMAPALRIEEKPA